MSSSASSSARSPARSRAWSSASTTRITIARPNGQDGADPQAAGPSGRPSVKRAAEGACARSRMPRMPAAVPPSLVSGVAVGSTGGRAPTPSSSTDDEQPSVAVLEDDLDALRAEACRMTFVTASCTMRKAASSTAAGSGSADPVDRACAR